MFKQIAIRLIIILFFLSAFNFGGCCAECERSMQAGKGANPAEMRRQRYLYAIKTAYQGGPGAFELLWPYLGDTEFVYLSAEGLFTIDWPETAQICFYAWGREANPYFMTIISQSRNTNEIAAAMEILAINQHRPAIAGLRTLSSSSDPKIRNTAVQCLAMFAEPQDKAGFIMGLQSEDAEYRAACIEALTLYRDPNTAVLIAPFLDYKDEVTSETALGALMLLPCPQSYDAVKNAFDNTENRKLRDVYAQAIREFCDYLDTTAEQYEKLSYREKQQLYKIANERAEQPYVLEDGEKTLSKRQIKHIISKMSRRKTLELSEYPDLREAHFIAVLEPGDIEMLLDLRAGVAAKLGQSGLEDYRTMAEIEEINEIIKRIAQN
jgi:hypothetical protein